MWWSGKADRSGRYRWPRARMRDMVQGGPQSVLYLTAPLRSIVRRPGALGEKAPATSGCALATTTNLGDGSRRVAGKTKLKLRFFFLQCAQKDSVAIRLTEPQARHGSRCREFIRREAFRIELRLFSVPLA